jgi:hypothetical protein
MKDRKTALDEFFGLYVEKSMESFPELMEKALSEKGEEARREAVRAFESVCEKALEEQNQGELGDAILICFSFLRTGLANEKGVYLIEVYDEAWLSNTLSCHEYWEAAFAFEPYFRLVREWKEQRRHFGQGVIDADIDYFALGLSLFPQFSSDALLAELGRTLGTLPAYIALSKRDCAITVGEYRDTQAVIFPIGDDNEG